MADIELVIKIPDKVYKNLKDPSIDVGYYATDVCDCVINGTILPKGHGRLIDERDVYEKIRPHVNNGVLDDIMFSLTPIIEADKESEE